MKELRVDLPAAAILGLKILAVILAITISASLIVSIGIQLLKLAVPLGVLAIVWIAVVQILKLKPVTA